jgi:hypothetical protein
MVSRFVVVALVLIACSGSTTSTTLIAAARPPTSVSVAPPTRDSVPETTVSAGVAIDIEDPLEANAAAFVAALEEAFLGTSFEGAVLDSPEVFLATAEVICVRLDNGDSVDQILIDYLAGLSNTDRGGDTVGETEAAKVAGGVLGASLELFCPQHKELIED